MILDNKYGKLTQLLSLKESCGESHKRLVQELINDEEDRLQSEYMLAHGLLFDIVFDKLYDGYNSYVDSPRYDEEDINVLTKYKELSIAEFISDINCCYNSEWVGRDRATITQVIETLYIMLQDKVNKDYDYCINFIKEE